MLATAYAASETRCACRWEMRLPPSTGVSLQWSLVPSLPPPPQLPEAQPQELTKARPQQRLEAQGLQLPEAQAQELPEAQAQELPEAQAQKFPPGAQGEPGLELLLPVRLLAPQHLEACVALDRQALNGIWSRQQWGIELADPQRPGLGIWQRRQLLAMACAWLIVDELHITLVAVDPSQRRQGLGRRILAALLREGSRLGAQRATLEVASGNQAAQSLYASLGFEVAGCRRGYYSNGDDALIEWLKLRV